jgi:hypothetical protein
MDINNISFPEAKEGDKVLWQDKWYVFVNDKWVLENNN